MSFFKGENAGYAEWQPKILKSSAHSTPFLDTFMDVQDVRTNLLTLSFFWKYRCLKLEPGAHQTPFLDTFTWCVGWWYMIIYWLSAVDNVGFSFLSWKKTIIKVSSEVTKRKTVDSYCFIIILKCYYFHVVSFFVNAIKSNFNQLRGRGSFWTQKTSLRLTNWFEVWY